MADTRRALAPVGLVVGALVVAEAVGLGRTGDAIPAAVLTKALIAGAANALLVVALVLVYRAARVINFALVGFGLLAVMAYLLLRVVWGWSFWLVIPLVLVGSAGLGAAVELAVIRRFARAPRLVLTVVTIGIGQLLAGAALLAPALFGLHKDDPFPPAGPRTPLSSISIRWFPEVFTGEHLLTAAVALIALVGLGLFLQRTKLGVSVRASAENRDRAASLGVNVGTVSLTVWVLTAVLAAVAALLQAMALRTSLVTTIGAAGSAAVGAPVLLRTLAAGVVARMERIPTAVAAALGIAVLDSGVYWAFRRGEVVDAVLLGVVVVSLALQRRGLGRVDPVAAASWEAAEELRGIPAPLAALPAVRRMVRRAAALLAVVVLAFPWVMSPSQTLQGSLFVIYGIVAVSIVILTGWGGQISLGQFGFVAIGALSGGALTAKAGLPFLVALVLAAAIGAGAAVIIGLPALRVQGLFLAVTSLAFAVTVQSVLLNPNYVGSLVPAHVGRPVFLGLDMNKEQRGFYYLCIAVLVAVMVAALGLRRSRTGRVLIAMRDNERAAQSYGLNLARVRLTTFAISGAFAAVAGMLFACQQFGVKATAFGTDQSLQMFLLSVIGGLGSVWGVLLGAVYFGVVRIVIGGVAGQLLAGAVGVLLVLVAFPGGLGGVAYRLRDTWLRRVALRYRIFVPSLLGVDRRSGTDELVPITPRPEELPDVEEHYRVPSLIGVAGSSQTTRTWRG